MQVFCPLLILLLLLQLLAPFSLSLSYLRSLGYQTIVLDGRVEGLEGPFSLGFYVNSRAIAQLTNTHPSFREGQNNASYYNVHEEGGYQMYPGFPSTLPPVCVHVFVCVYVC